MGNQDDGAAQRLGWIGTGRMGSAMAGRLIDAGHPVRLWNRTAAKARPLVDRGAEAVVESPAELSGQDVVFTMVSTGADLEQVLFGPAGLLTAPRRPRVLVDSSTVDLQDGARIRDRVEALGIDMLAAPVSGNAKAVAAGALAMAVSGPREAADSVAGLLAVIARSVTYVGPGEVARLVKICHNLLLGVVTQSLAEITVLAQKGGVSRHDLLAFLNESVLGSTFTRYKTPAFVNLDMTATFTPTLLRKDFDLGLAAGRALEAPMPVAALVHQLVAATVAEGHDDDFAVLLLNQARSAGITLEPENRDVGYGFAPAPSNGAPLGRTAPAAD